MSGNGGAGGRRTLWAHLAVIATVTAVAYANALPNGFVYDDKLIVLANDWVKEPGHLGEIFGSHFWAFLPTSKLSGNYYRPLVLVVHRVQHLLLGEAPWGYHLTNVLAHVAASCAVYLLACRLVRRAEPGAATEPTPAALVAGLVFALHPVHVEAVSWVSGIADVGMTLLVLLAALSLSLGAGWGSAWVAAGALLAALLFKEPAAALLALAPASEWLLGGASGPGRRKRLLRYAPLLAAFAVYLGMRLNAVQGVSSAVQHAYLGAWGYVINVPPLVAEYLGVLFVPTSLSLVHLMRPVGSLLEPRAIAGLAALLGLAAVVYVGYARDRRVLVSVLWLVVPLAPALYIPALGRHAFTERYLYLPSLGFALLAGLGFEALGRVGAGRLARPAWAALALVCGAYGIATTARNVVWRDSLTLWQDTVEKAPDSVVANYQVGVAYLEAGQIDRAIEHLEIAVGPLGGMGMEGHRNLGVAYARAGRLAEAAAHLERAVAIEPEDAASHINLGLAYKNLGQLDRALFHAQEAIRLDPTVPEAHGNLGNLLFKLGKSDEAIQAFARAIELKPDYAEAHFNLARVYQARGEVELASRHRAKAIELRPELARPR